MWVWADSSPIAKLQAAATPTCAPDVHDESQHELLWLANWFVRDVPYGADVLAENIMDPSHVQFSHHNVIGNRNAVSCHQWLWYLLAIVPPEAVGASMVGTANGRILRCCLPRAAGRRVVLPLCLIFFVSLPPLFLWVRVCLHVSAFVFRT